VLALEGTPREVLEHEGLMQLLLPTLRADFELVETYRHAAGPPLACPLTVFGGDRDPMVAPAQLEGWREHAQAPAELLVLPGGHFFVAERAEEVIGAVAARLAASDSAPPML